jgi:hypothetical protein
LRKTNNLDANKVQEGGGDGGDVSKMRRKATGLHL